MKLSVEAGGKPESDYGQTYWIHVRGEPAGTPVIDLALRQKGTTSGFQRIRVMPVGLDDLRAIHEVIGTFLAGAGDKT